MAAACQAADVAWPRRVRAADNQRCCGRKKEATRSSVAKTERAARPSGPGGLPAGAGFTKGANGRLAVHASR
jgi:hypothetical protein